MMFFGQIFGPRCQIFVSRYQILVKKHQYLAYFYSKMENKATQWLPRRDLFDFLGPYLFFRVPIFTGVPGQTLGKQVNVCQNRFANVNNQIEDMYKINKLPLSHMPSVESFSRLS